MLGIAPASELVRFREDANDSFHLDDDARVSLTPANFTANSTDGELKAQVRRGVPSGNHPANESIIIQKRTALGPKSVLTAPEVGKLPLWQFAGPEGKVEDLNMRVFVDGSAIEVYIIDVFVMTTRGYYWYEDSIGVGFVYQLPHGEDAEGMRVESRNTSWWEGLIDAYPNRPKDAGQLIREDIGYPEPTNIPNAQGIVYNGTGPAPPLPNLG